MHYDNFYPSKKVKTKYFQICWIEKKKKNDDSDQIIHEERKKNRTFFWFYMWYIWNSSSTSNPFFKRESIACPRLSYRWDLSQILFQPVSFVSEKQYSTNSCIKYSIFANIFHTTFNILSTHLCVPPRTHTHISITNEPVHSLYLSIVFSKRSFCSRCFNAR